MQHLIVVQAHESIYVPFSSKDYTDSARISRIKHFYAASDSLLQVTVDKMTHQFNTHLLSNVYHT